MKPSRLLLAVVVVLLAAGAWWLARSTTPAGDELKPADAPAPSAPEAALSQPVTTPVTEIPETLAAAPIAETGSARAEADPHQLELLVIDPDSRPVAEARVALFREADMLAQGTTDEQGLARWPPQTGKARFIVSPLGWDLVLGELDLAAGRTTVRLVDDASLAGHVIVDGVPAAPFELHWSSERRDLQDLPSAVYRALRRADGAVPMTATLTAADGSFTLRGLRPDVKGALSWIEPYFRRGLEGQAGRKLELDAPRSGLVLDLVAGCVLRLRVVDPRGNPLPQASVKVDRDAIIDGFERRSASTSLRAEADGTYRQALPPPMTGEQLSVSVAPAGSTAWKRHVLSRPPGQRGVWDVGDLEASDLRNLLVHVEDPDGNPIEGANVSPWPSESSTRVRGTDATGMITIAIRESQAEIAVEAFTYVSTVEKIPAGAEAMSVTLQRACMLEFELSDPTRGREGLVLELTGPTPMLEEDHPGTARPDQRKRPYMSATEPGITSTVSSGAGRTSLLLQPARDLRWRASALLPHQTLHVTLRGGGTLLCSLDVPALSQGEHRKVTLPIPPAGSPLIVRVLNPEGAPVPTAMILSESGESARLTTQKQVGAGGELELPWVTGERVDFVVSAPGFPHKRVSLSPIPVGRHDVVLEPPQSLEVELVRGDGTPYTAAVRFTWPASFGRLQPPTGLGDGAYRIDAMPSEPVLLSMHGEFGSVYRYHRAGEPRLRVVVDEPGAIEVDVEVPQADLWNWRVEVAMPGGGKAFTSAGVWASRGAAPRARFEHLPLGEYELWLVHAEVPFVDTFERVGTPVRVAIDAQRPSAKARLEPPQ